MKMAECIDQLKNLQEHCREMSEWEDSDGVWQADVEALDIAIRTMEDGRRKLT